MKTGEEAETEGSDRSVPSHRFSEVLKEIIQKTGLSQRQLAARLNIPVQYVTDYKTGRRSLTERDARRIEDEFGYSWRWLLGLTDEALKPTTAAGTPTTAASNCATSLPVLPYPIEGDPRLHPKWEGLLMEVQGPAQAKLAQASLPYILKFGATDREGRLRPGDFILMSQAPPLEDANYSQLIQVIRVGRGLYLARKKEEGWVRLAEAANDPIPQDCQSRGYALGIIWGSLL